MQFVQNKKYQSWAHVYDPDIKNELLCTWSNSNLQLHDDAYLAYGQGRSYGDSCLNNDGTIINTSKLNHILFFDKDNGVLRCEAGVTLDDILSVIVPHGWFLPVTPGTRFVTIAGAVSNDVHGKNHHRVGSFGNHVLAFEILRSSGEPQICTPSENKELFSATIGGLGLTGLIRWVEIKLKKIVNSSIVSTERTFTSVNEFFELDDNYLEQNEYTVAWVDTTSTGTKLGRGVYFSGDHAKEHRVAYSESKLKKRRLNIPFNMPGYTLNSYVVRAFNQVYYNLHKNNSEQKLVHYEPFFYPLDNVLNWNRLYGKRGFFQHQCVVPVNDGKEVIKEILRLVSNKNMASFLSVLKRFGNIPSVGMLSFPREGYTLALDFPNKGKRTLDFLNDLDKLVKSVNGAVYPAKDARMSSEMFVKSFPGLNQFKKYIDPSFSSSFWRRVNPE